MDLRRHSFVSREYQCVFFFWGEQSGIPSKIIMYFGAVAVVL